VAGEGVLEEFFPRVTTPERLELWHRSPWYRMLEEDRDAMRHRLADGEGCAQFPLLADLAGQGGVDYWARIVSFGERTRLGETRGVATSWTTRDPAGFSDGDLALIEATLPAFALAFKATMWFDTARTVVATYLGREPAARVLRGEIDRGKATSLRKVLWLSDLRGFTRTADILPQEQLLEFLNAYADRLVSVVHDHDGEVLKFMGDGILAAIGGDQACEQALDAALAVRRAVDALNRARITDGLPTTTFSLALHEGEVLYGNVGSRERLDFTVIGPAVNEASRIQVMCRSLDQPILISASFAAACGRQRQRLLSVGHYALRGVGRPQELFTLDVERAAGNVA
jgi:adenylate cyclase